MHISKMVINANSDDCLYFWKLFQHKKIIDSASDIHILTFDFASYFDILQSNFDTRGSTFGTYTLTLTFIFLILTKANAYDKSKWLWPKSMHLQKVNASDDGQRF